MGLRMDYMPGQTPLDEDEKEGLLIETIAIRRELDEFEQLNIQEAVEWSLISKFDASRVFTEKFILEVHKRMFGHVWEWAGRFRKSNKNIGVDKYIIGVSLGQLLGDVKYWYDNQVYKPDELAIRFTHRLVKIHPFSNGNGRHSRLMADITVSHLYDLKVFSWGGADLSGPGDIRREYLDSIYEADKGNYRPLLQFSRK